jgi:hypothetical protein
MAEDRRGGRQRAIDIISPRPQNRGGVTSGTNAIKNTIKGYKAGPGWNACTSLGIPDGTAILNNLA